jgi:hypothetical protein
LKNQLSESKNIANKQKCNNTNITIHNNTRHTFKVSEKLFIFPIQIFVLFFLLTFQQTQQQRREQFSTLTLCVELLILLLFVIPFVKFIQNKFFISNDEYVCGVMENFSQTKLKFV